MKPVLILWWVFALVASGSSAFAQGSRVLHAGNLTAEIPAGWHGSVVDGNMVFAPGAVAKPGNKDEITILVSEGSARVRTVNELTAQTWKAFAAGMKVIDKKQGPASRTSAGFDLQITFATVQAGTDRATLMVGALLKSDAQAVVVVFMTRPELFQQQAQTIATLVDSIDAGAGHAPTTPVAPAPAPMSFPAPQPIAGMGKGVAGTWAVLQHGAHAHATGVVIETQWDIYVLLPDGRYAERLDPDGLNGKTAAQLESKFSWGTYSVSGHSVTFRTSNNIRSTYRLHGNTMTPTGDTSGSELTRADTGADFRLSGTYAREDYKNQTYGSQLPAIVFHADGTFDDRFGGAYTILSAKASTTHGTYRIHHNSLYLAYDDGTRTLGHVAILPTGGSRAAPNGLYVNDHWLTRR